MIQKMKDDVANYNTTDHHEQDHHHHQQEEEEEVDEALSLSELPLHSDQTLNPQTTSYNSNGSSRRSSSEPQEFFEFFSDFNGGSDDRRGDMCSAEDIIFCGRLVPYREHPPTKSEPATAPPLRRRSESLSALQSSSGASKAAVIMRNSRSLDYQKLRRASHHYSTVAPPAKRAELAASPKKAARPRWSALLVFGVVKLPAEMELGDIKSRQARRSADAGGSFPISRSSSGKGAAAGGASWRLLKALSCKDHASVAVTASLCVPHV